MIGPVVMMTATPMGNEPTSTGTHSPPPHEINTWGEHGAGVAVSREAYASLALSPDPWGLRPAAMAQTQPASTGVGAGFSIVGSVAVLQGDELTTAPSGTGFGVNKDNLAEISSRFIAAFGDDFDQIAVFLGFSDRLSQQALAYQQPVKNDIKGLGLGTFDETRRFGSPSGRMESMLNMKRINLYGRDAANDPENDLYSVWAQEAAHRWAVYFKYRFLNDTSDRTDLLLRQNAHWAPWVHADASFLDGMFWQPQADGKFQLTEMNKRYSAFDQYAMGLRTPADLPPFFMLDNFKDEEGKDVAREGRFSRGRSYTARRIEVTIEDIVRAMGPRIPATSPAAEDLRMGVVFLTPPDIGPNALMGEAFRVETTRAPWDGFYNASAGGRGKVCTELLHPCRGPSFVFGPPVLTGMGKPSGLSAPGDSGVLTLPLTNVGTEQGPASVAISGQHPLVFSPAAATPPLAPGQSSTLTFPVQIPADTACGVPFKLDFVAPGRLGPSKGSHAVTVGLTPGPGTDFEDPSNATTWQVDPDGTDTATLGMWEWGTPEQTKAFDFILQPGGGASGVRAFVTGAAAGENPEDNDVDFDLAKGEVGRTTLQSPAFALAGLVNPRLSYQLHFVAAGFEREVLVPGPQDAFYVQASLDGGAWVEIDRVPSSLFLTWQHRVVPLQVPLGGAVATATNLRLRFVAEDHPYSETVVEAVIDDVFLLSEMPGCGGTSVGPPPAPPPAQPKSGGCQYGGGTNLSFLWVLGILLVLADKVLRKSYEKQTRV